MSIYSELVRIQQGLKAPKNLFNKFGNYYYRNAEGILEALKPLLGSLALLINDEPVLIGDRFYIKSTVTLTDGKESVSAVAYAREDETKKGMDGCQITGACSSYARKYALNALLLIDDSKDSDDDSLSPKNPLNAEDKDDKQTPPPVKQFTPPPASSGAVANISTLPPVQKEEAPKDAPNPVQLYLMSQMKMLREMRQISFKENNKLFEDQLKALIGAGLAPDKKTSEYTMQEAESLIDAMIKNFPPKSAVMNQK